MKYIGIEGSSYAGKTTVGRYLETRGHLLIHEYDSFGSFLTSDGSFEGLVSVVDDLLLRERARTMMLAKVATTGYAFSDRTPISFVTFEDMRVASAQNASELDLHQRVREYAFAKLEESIRLGDLVLPDAIAILRLSTHTEFATRVRHRGTTKIEELANFDMQNYIADKTTEYATQLVGAPNTHPINVDGLSVRNLAHNIEVINPNILHSKSGHN